MILSSKKYFALCLLTSLQRDCEFFKMRPRSLREEGGSSPSRPKSDNKCKESPGEGVRRFIVRQDLLGGVNEMQSSR